MTLTPSQVLAIVWLVLAVLWLPVAAYLDFAAIHLIFPLAQQEGELFYYPTEDQIALPGTLGDYRSQCDDTHPHQRVIPISAPMNFKKLTHIGILTICTDEEAGDKWVYGIKTDQEVRDALDHIEAVALRRDWITLVGLGAFTVLPTLGCLVAFAVMIRPGRRAGHDANG